MQYTFGETELAARRLELVDRIFAPLMRKLVAQAVAAAPRLTYDLGCGPGCSTRSLAAALSAGPVIGLDSSEEFLRRARQAAGAGVRFLRHDVTVTPFPAGPASLLYCRFLLTHLPRPGETLAGWASQLQPSGLLLIEELERIDTSNPVFRCYLELVERLLAHQGQQLYVGPLLARLPVPPGLRQCLSRATPLAVPDRWAAAMFSLNLPTLQRQPFVLANYPKARIERLQTELEAIAAHGGDDSGIAWSLRQLAFEPTE